MLRHDSGAARLSVFRRVTCMLYQVLDHVAQDDKLRERLGANADVYPRLLRLVWLPPENADQDRRENPR